VQIERAIALQRERGDPASALVDYAILAVETGDHETARLRLRAALERCRALGIRAILTDSLLGLAVLAAREGRGEQAAQLVGAAAGERQPWTLDRLEARLERTLGKRHGSIPWRGSGVSQRGDS
jgi:hypothetical protein